MEKFDAVFFLNKDDGDCMVVCDLTGILSQKLSLSDDQKEIRVADESDGVQKAVIEVPDGLQGKIKIAFLVEVTEFGRPVRTGLVEVSNG